MRLLLASTLNAMPERESIDYVVLSDIVFFGILLNAAAVMNSASEKAVPSVFNKILGVALVSSLFLTIVYVADITAGLSQNYYAWVGVLLLTGVAMLLSYYSTDHEELKKLQATLDCDDVMASLKEPLRSAIEGVIQKKLTEQTVDFDTEMKKLEEIYGPFDRYVRSDYAETIQAVIQRETARREQELGGKVILT